MTVLSLNTYPASAALTITLNSLASAGVRQSTAVDNTSNLYVDAIVNVIAVLASGTPSSGINVYVAGSEDGTNWPDGLGATDAAYTMRSPTNLSLVRPIWTARPSTAPRATTTWPRWHRITSTCASSPSLAGRTRCSAT